VNVSRDEAAQALEEIGRAGSRMQRLSVYADMAPMFVLWGVIWLIANLVTEFAPDWSGRAWFVGTVVVGTPLTLWLTVRHARRAGARMRQAGVDGRALGNRMALLGVTGFGVFVSMMFIVMPLNPRQQDAFISLFFAASYAFGGVFGGWRLYAIGAVTTLAVVFGYLVLQQHFFLWMGLVGGGSLLAGGLWLRKA
jgi:hypothetical protein